MEISVWDGSSVESINESFVGADNLRWEKSIKTNIGLEGNMFNDKISIVLDYFDDLRDGIFQQRSQIPSYVGAITLPFGNVGKMRSYGADGNASFTHTLNKNSNFTLRGNFTYSKNDSQLGRSISWYPYLEEMDFHIILYVGTNLLGFSKIGMI